MAEELIRIAMSRPNLENIPQYKLAPGYSARWYQVGFEKRWVDIHVAADKYGTFDLGFFAKIFGSDSRPLSRRQCYLLDPEARFIGTASAWFLDQPDQSTGLVHWLAIIPDYRGRGLAKPLLSIVLNRMRELGHSRAYLRTATVAIPAINLYAKFGFVPYIRTAADLQLWSGLQHKLKKPLDLDQFSEGFANHKG